MKWKEIALAAPATLVFPDNTAASVSIFFGRSTYGRPENRLVISFPNKRIVELADVIDIGETESVPHVFVISSDLPNQVVLFGGPVVCRLDNLGTVQDAFKIYREEKDAEYWSTQFVDTESGLLIIYEGGILLINTQLEAVWHIKKYYNDFYKGIENGNIKILRDHKEKWSVSLQSGYVVTEIN
jgi:hypothetical protein